MAGGGGGAGLTAIGVAAIGTVDPGAAADQGGRWLLVAVVVAAAGVLVPPRVVAEMAYPLLGVSLLLLLYVIVPGAPRVPRVNGATAWIDLGVMRFQPSEMGKVAFVLALAAYLRGREEGERGGHRTWRGLVVPAMFMLVPVGLILKEPDLGQALVFGPTLLVVLLAAGAKLRHLGAVAAVGVVGLAVVVGAIVADPPHERAARGGEGTLPTWAHPLAGHQEKRIAALIWPAEYASREAYQQQTSTRLIAAGGAVGLGERAELVIEHNHLPESHNDMIFAVVVARWGLVAAAGVLGLYLLLTGSILAVAAGSVDPFARLVCVGFAGMLFTQASINIGMTIGLLPVTGIVLPFMSYGGSSLVFSFSMVALAVNFAARRAPHFARSSFEYDGDPLRRRLRHHRPAPPTPARVFS